ncbi:MAG: GAF domain-containing protein [Bacteroidales bacterium]|nr:GAF domain-containing protein [Bacteroidales bacterium]
MKKYRKFSITALIILVVGLLLTFAALLNSLRNSNAQKEGWVVFFVLILFATGIFLFFIAFRSTDEAELENVKKLAFEAGKKETLQEMESRKQEETSEEKNESEAIDHTVASVLTGMQGIRAINSFCNKVLSNLGREMGFVQGIIYVKDAKDNLFSPTGEYALTDRKPGTFEPGEGLAGQVAESKTRMVLYDVPENYFTVSSGLGNSQPRFLLIVPVLNNDESIAVIELAAFKKPDALTGKILDKLASELGPRIHKFAVA